MVLNKLPDLNLYFVLDDLVIVHRFFFSLNHVLAIESLI